MRRGGMRCDDGATDSAIHDHGLFLFDLKFQDSVESPGRRPDPGLLVRAVVGPVRRWMLMLI